MSGEDVAKDLEFDGFASSAALVRSLERIRVAAEKPVKIVESGRQAYKCLLCECWWFVEKQPIHFLGCPLDAHREEFGE